jgi:hypothetical protein
MRLLKPKLQGSSAMPLELATSIYMKNLSQLQAVMNEGFNLQTALKT